MEAVSLLRGLGPDLSPVSFCDPLRYGESQTISCNLLPGTVCPVEPVKEVGKLLFCKRGSCIFNRKMDLLFSMDLFFFQSNGDFGSFIAVF